MLKYHLILKSFFICFIVLLCFSACSKKQNDEQIAEVSIAVDLSSTNNITSEKLDDAIKSTESSNTETSKDLLQAIELKLKIVEAMKKGLRSEDDFFTMEEIELLSTEDLKQYILVLQNFYYDMDDNALQYIIDSKIIDKLDANMLKNSFNTMSFYKTYDSRKTLDNLKIFLTAIKNTGDHQLLDDFFEIGKNIIQEQDNDYVAHNLCTQLLEYYNDDPEKKQELQFINLQKNAEVIPYAKFEENMQAFLIQADQQYTNYGKILEFYARKKTENQLINEEEKMDKWEFESISRTKNFEEYHKNILENIKLNENNAATLEYLNKKLENAEIYLNVYSNHLQQLETKYLR